MTLIISSQHAVRESSLLELACASDSHKWFGGGRGRGKRQLDQKEGRKDQPPPTAASMLIKISFCLQLVPAWGGCRFSANPDTKPWQRAVWSGGKCLSAFFRVFGTARVSQGAVDAWLLSQHLRGSASSFLPLVSFPRQSPEHTAAADLALPWGNLFLFLQEAHLTPSPWHPVSVCPSGSHQNFSPAKLTCFRRQLPTAQTLQSELSLTFCSRCTLLSACCADGRKTFCLADELSRLDWGDTGISCPASLHTAYWWSQSCACGPQPLYGSKCLLSWLKAFH